MEQTDERTGGRMAALLKAYWRGHNKKTVVLVIVLPTNCVSLSGKHVIPLSLSTSLNSFLAIFRSDVLPIQISLPDHPVLLATFPLGLFCVCAFYLELSTCTHSFYRHPVHL